MFCPNGNTRCRPRRFPQTEEVRTLRRERPCRQRDRAARPGKKLVQLPTNLHAAPAPTGSTNIQIRYLLIRGSYFPAFAFRVYLRSSAVCRENIQPAATISTPATIMVQLSVMFSDKKLAADPTPTLSP